MKHAIISAFLAFGAPVFGGVVFIDLAGIAVPLNTADPDDPANFTGVYVNILTGAAVYSEPGDFNEAPWINLFAGGQGISTSALLRPLATQAPGLYDPEQAGNYYVNVAPGTTIDGSLINFVTGESASISHLGTNPDQFHAGVQGYLVFAYEGSVGGDTAYGWFSFTPNDSGPGYSVDLAYSDTPGESLSVGAIPEPSAAAALAGVIGLGAVVCRRRRSA